MRHLEAGDALHASKVRHLEAEDALHASKVRQTGPWGAILPERKRRARYGAGPRYSRDAPGGNGARPLADMAPLDSSAGNEMTRDRGWGRCYR